MKNRVSIITPAYNAEEYIERSILCSLSQDYDNIEVIVVDDGSTDNTTEILARIANRDKRLILIRQNHKGPNSARKAAIEKASGEYVLFVDADDYLERNAASTLVNYMSKNDIDSIRFNAKNIRGRNIIHRILDAGEKEKTLHREDALHLLMTSYKLNALWMQLYKTDVLRSIKAFDNDIIFGEDYLVNLEYHQKTNDVLVIEDILYNYNNIGSYSTTRNNSRERVISNLSDRIYVSRKTMELSRIVIENEMERKEIVISQLRMIVDCLMKISKIKNYNKNLFLTDIDKTITSDIVSSAEKDELVRYMKTQKLSFKVRYLRIILALIDKKNDALWNYLKLRNLCAQIAFWRAK